MEAPSIQRSSSNICRQELSVHLNLLDRWRRQLNNQRISVVELFAGKRIDIGDRAIADAGLDAPLEEALQRCDFEIEQADLVIAGLDGGAMEAGFALASGKRAITMETIWWPLILLHKEEVKAVRRAHRPQRKSRAQ
jgi:nucleoside 2-deoxyribosyltransferase